MSISAGIIGTGMMGRIHADAARRSGARVGAVAGSSISRARDSSQAWAFGATVQTVDDVLSNPDIDVVHVCVPNHLHFPIAMAAIDAGKHVVCEKPLAVSVDESRELERSAARAGVVATVPFVYRYHPLVMEAKARILNQEAGNLHLVHGSYLQDWLSTAHDTNWRVDGGLGGPSRAFADIGSHWCDLVEWVSGLRITEVAASTSTVFDDRGAGIAQPVSTEDIACVNLRFSNGALGTVVVSQVSPGRKNRLYFEMSGTLATVAFDQEHPEAMWWGTTMQNTSIVRDPRSLSSGAAEASSLPGGHPMGYYDCFHSFVADTYRAVAGETVPRLPTFGEGVRTSLITDAVLKSAVTGTWISIEP
jgi:predicted dehydrogenase